MIVRLGVDSKGMNRGFNKAETRAQKFGRTLNKVRTGAVAGMSLAITGIGASAIRAAIKYEEATATIRAGTGATGAELKALEGNFQSLMRQVPQTAEQVSIAIANLNTRTGQTGKNLEKLAKQFLDLSRITKTDVATNVSQLTRVFGDWSIAVEDQSKTLDFLFKTVQKTGVPLQQLQKLIVSYGVPLRTLSFEFKEAAALIAKFEKEGVNVEAVMGGLKIGIDKLAKTGNAVKAFEDITKAIKAAKSASEGAIIAAKAFGTRAGADVAGAIREGRFEIEDMIVALDASADSIDRVAKETLTLIDNFKLLKNQIDQDLIDVFKEMVIALKAVIRFFGFWNKVIKTVAGWIGKLSASDLGFLVQLIPGVTVNRAEELAKALKEIWETLSKKPDTSLGDLRNVTPPAFMRNRKAKPTIADVLPPGPTAEELALIAKEQKRIDDLFSDQADSLFEQVSLWGKLTEVERINFELTKGGLTELSSDQAGYLEFLASELDELTRAAEARDKWNQRVKEGKSMLEAIATPLEILNKAEEDLNERLADTSITAAEHERLMRAITQAYSDAVIPAQDMARTLEDVTEKTFVTFADLSGGLQMALVSGFQTFQENMRNIQGAVMSAVQGILAAINRLLLNKLAAQIISSLLAAAVGDLFTSPGTPNPFAGKGGPGRFMGLAKGGVMKSPFALVGEEGPELIQAPTGSRVFSNKDSQGMTGGSFKIVNVWDSAVVQDELASNMGERTVINHVLKNKRALGIA